MDRAVIGGEQDLDAPPLGLPERVPERRALEPGAGQIAQRRGIACHLVQRRILGATVRKLIDEAFLPKR